MEVKFGSIQVVFLTDIKMAAHCGKRPWVLDVDSHHKGAGPFLVESVGWKVIEEEVSIRPCL